MLEVTVITESDSCFIPCEKHESKRRIHVWPEMEEHPCDVPTWRADKWCVRAPPPPRPAERAALPPLPP